MIIRIFFILTVLSSVVAFGAERQEPSNLIKNEMAALDGAFKATIDAIVLNDPERIAPAFDQVNAIRTQVERVVKSGPMLSLPRNQKRFKEFVRLDEKFHRELEVLLKAAKRKNMLTVRRQTHMLLDFCVRCHVVFRK